MGDLDKIAKSVSDTGFVQSIARGIGYTPDSQQLSEWNQADELRKLYNSQEFNSVPPPQRAQLEKKLYDEHIAPSYLQHGRKAPTFDQWVDFRVSKNFDKNVSKMYDVFEPRSGFMNQVNDYSGRVARSFTELAENLYIKEIMNFGKVQNPLKETKGEDKVTHWFDNLKQAESHFVDKNSPVDAHWSRKLVESVAGSASDFAVFAAVQRVTPSMATGVVSKLNLTEALSQSKLGQFALKRLIGAADMYMSEAVAGKQPSATGAVIGGIAGGGSSEIKKYLANQMVLMGPKVTTALMQAAVPSVEHAAEVAGTDILTDKLTKANSEIYNSVARKMGYAMYNVVPKAEKFKVKATIFANMQEVVKNPLANADPTLQKFMVEQHLMENMSPELMQGLKQSAEVQAKAGVKPGTEGLVEEEVAKAKAEQPENNLRLEAADRVVPGAASSKSPEFKSNLPRADMKLEGDINQYVYALGHYMAKNPNGPYAKHMLNELSAQLPHLKPEDIKMLPAALQQHMEDLITTGHTSPEDIRGVFRSTNLDAIFGKGKPTEFQDELASEVEDVQKIAKHKKKK